MAVSGADQGADGEAGFQLLERGHAPLNLCQRGKNFGMFPAQRLLHGIQIAQDIVKHVGQSSEQHDLECQQHKPSFFLRGPLAETCRFQYL